MAACREVDMDKTSGLQLMALSRRTIVARSVAAAAGVAVLFGLVTEAAAKMSQKSVDYQDTPKNDQECSNCSLFQEPNSCTISTARSVRRVGVNSGPKSQAERERSPATIYKSDAVPPRYPTEQAGPEQRPTSSSRHVCLWHFADITTALNHVRFWG